MKTILFGLFAVLFGVFPASAKNKEGNIADVMKLKRILLCGVDGEPFFQYGQKLDSQRLASGPALEKALEELSQQWKEAGVPLIDPKEAEAAADEQIDKAAQGQADQQAAKSEAFGNAAEDETQKSMGAAMESPGMSPEARAAMAQYMSGKGGNMMPNMGQVPGGGKGMGAGLAAIGGTMKKKQAVAEMSGKHGSKSSRNVIALCPTAIGRKTSDEILQFYAEDAFSRKKATTDARMGKFYAFLDKVGADGFAYVRLSFGSTSIDSSVVTGHGSMNKSSFKPILSLSGRFWDKDGKVIFPVFEYGKNVEVGGTVGSAEKAITEEVPDLTAQLTRKYFK